MIKDSVEFRGKCFPCVGVTGIDGCKDHRFIAGESMEDAVTPGIYYEETDAIAADNLIFYYVPDEMLDKSEDEIRQYVNDNIVQRKEECLC